MLLQAQARECLLEKLQLQSKDKNDPDIFLDLAHEAQTVSGHSFYFHFFFFI